jgi:hypothetical protein
VTKVKKALIAALILLGSCHCAIAQCGDPTFGPNDGQKEVQKKLTCFADQNAKLQHQVEALQAQISSMDVQGYISAVPYNSFVYPPQQCISNAQQELANEHASIISNTETALTFHIGTAKGVVLCQTPQATGYVIINRLSLAGPQEEVADLARRLANAFFKPGQH